MTTAFLSLTGVARFVLVALTYDAPASESSSLVVLGIALFALAALLGAASRRLRAARRREPHPMPLPPRGELTQRAG